MSRSDDDELDDDEEDRPRRKSRRDDHEDDDEGDDSAADDDEEVSGPLGGWRPLGEAVFWGAIFTGLTLVAFSLGEGIAVNRPLAEKTLEAEKAAEPAPTPEPPTKEEPSAFDGKIESPKEGGDEADKPIDLNAPPPQKRAPITPAKAVQLVEPPDEPTTRLDWDRMVAKAEVKLTPKPVVKAAPPSDEGPTSRLPVQKLTRLATLLPRTRRTDFAAMVRTVELQPATQLLDPAALVKEVTIVPKGTRLDWATMVRTVALEPRTTQLDHEGMTKLVAFVPKPKQPTTVEHAAAQVPLKEVPAVAPASLQLREVPSLLQVGKAVVLVAKVVGANGQPLADQAVEWNLDRQGVGEITTASTEARVAKPSERPWPTFARTYTAKSAYRLDAAMGGAEIGVGETWIAVESASAGGMHATVQVPGIASPTAGRAGAHFHWDRAKAVFPDAATAQAGGEAAVMTKVIGNDADAPLPEYRVRYTLTESNGAETPSGDGVVEVESRGDGRAQAVFRQTSPKPGMTRGKIELLGRRPLSGRPAVVLASGEFAIRWTAPAITVASKFPSNWRLGETVVGSIVVQNKGDAAVHGLKVRQELPSGVRVVAADGAAVDPLGVTWELDRLDVGAEQDMKVSLQGTADGKRLLRAQVVGRSLAEPVAADAEVAIEGLPSLAVSIRDTADPAPAGREFDYEVVIENRGSAAARNVRVEFTPTGLEIVSVAGSLGGTMRNGGYSPPALDELPPGGRATAKLRVRPTGAGSSRLAVRLHHPSLAGQSLEEHETTVVYTP
jgi:hypothetical protein